MAQRHILLTGGAGYIGSHTYLALVDAGHRVTILDNFSNARQQRDRPSRAGSPAPRSTSSTPMSRRESARCRLRFRGFDAVVHFAALKAVSESVEKPLDYFDVNIGGLTTLLRTMDTHDCRTLVFSSSATVYGVPDETPTPETAEFRGMNPYGQTKIIGEQMLGWLSNPIRAGRSASCATSTPQARMRRP
jgi:UDP-glucose 4-epimerase